MTPENSIEARLREQLHARELKGQRRRLSIYPGYDFCSNDYLGLAQENQSETTVSSGGSTGSRLISGNCSMTERFEHDAAQFHGFENSLLFSSGYAANSGLLSCLAQSDDLLILDSLAHASLVDGARLSRAKYIRFAHNDARDLKRCLDEFESTRKSDRQQVFVVVESLYSMDGDIAPLVELAQCCKDYRAALIVDEAHAIGVYGDQGAGLIAQLDLQSDIFAAIFTFGKAVGRHGAIIAGSNTLRDYLINYCRPFIYTTAPSPQFVEALEVAYRNMRQANDQRKILRSNIDYFAKRVKSIELKSNFNSDANPGLKSTHSMATWVQSSSPIQALIIGDAQKTRVLAEKFRQAGFALKAIVSPTVPIGTERIRVCLHSTNTRDQVDRFASVLQSHLGIPSKDQAVAS